MSARWKIVPVEPTAGMLGAGYKRTRQLDIYFPDMSGCLASIVEATNAAAPRASEDNALVDEAGDVVLTALKDMRFKGVGDHWETECRYIARAVLKLLEGAQ